MALVKSDVKVFPTLGKVAVVLREPPKVTKGGIIIPDKAKDRRSQKGDVLAVSSGRLCEKTGVIVPFQVKPGDCVLVGTYAGASANADELPEGTRFCEESEIFAVLEE